MLSISSCSKFTLVLPLAFLVAPMCVDSPVDGNHMNQPVAMYPCHNQGGNQFWMLSKNGEIRRDEGCLDYAGQSSIRAMYPCHNQGGNQFWMLSKHGEIRRDEGCLDYAGQSCIRVTIKGEISSGCCLNMGRLEETKNVSITQANYVSVSQSREKSVLDAI